jgi:hypothetical protein
MRIFHIRLHKNRKAVRIIYCKKYASNSTFCAYLRNQLLRNPPQPAIA